RALLLYVLALSRLVGTSASSPLAAQMLYVRVFPRLVGSSAPSSYSFSNALIPYPVLFHARAQYCSTALSARHQRPLVDSALLSLPRAKHFRPKGQSAHPPESADTQPYSFDYIAINCHSNT